MTIFKKLLRKMFYYNAWQIGYRKIGDNFNLPIDNNKTTYNLIPISDSRYYADPFIYQHDGGIYLFAEYMNRYCGKGTIAVSRYINGRFTKFTEVLKEDFHLSFPNVFKQNGDIFMMPETSQKGQVRVYKAKSFPYEWELHAVLLDDNKPYVDSVFLDESKDKILCYYESDSEGANRCYTLNATDGLIKATQRVCECNRRPAGNAFKFNDKFYRAVQNGDNYYGKSMFIVDMTETEEIIGEIKVENLVFNRNIKCITGTHSLNRSAGFEVIDIKYERFCLTRPIIRIFQFIKKIWG